MVSAVLIFITGNCVANPINVIDFIGDNKGVQESFNFQRAGGSLTIQA